MTSVEEPSTAPAATTETPKASETPAAEPKTTATEAPVDEQAPPPPPKDDALPAAKEETKASEPTKPAEDCGCGPNIPDNAPVNAKLPTPADLEKVAKMEVQDAEGKKHPFKSIVEVDRCDKHLVIFIRHFFCGNCQEYIHALSTELPPSSLPSSTKLTVIGCGSPDLIASYTKHTSNTHALYAEPSQQIYKALGMGRTLDMGKKPVYIKSSLMSSVFKSIVQGLGAGKNATKGGDFMQVGGEFLFSKPAEETGAMWPATWAHRMKTTRDHAEVKELKGVLGIEISANGVGETPKSETKPRRSSTFFGRKDKETKKEKSEEKGAETAATAA